MTAAPFRGLRTVGASARRDHHFLRSSDDCRYLGVYCAGARHRCINRLIRDFKCHPSLAARDPVRAGQKQRAIEQIAAALRAATPRRLAESITWVPIPTSAVCADRHHDDRLHRTLQVAFGDLDLDVRALLQLTRTTRADHRAVERLGIGALHALLRLDEAALRSRPLRGHIVLFDDLLTSGKHYRCCERRLHDTAPTVPISGWFVARRVLRSRWWRCAEPLDEDDQDQLGGTD